LGCGVGIFVGAVVFVGCLEGEWVWEWEERSWEGEEEAVKSEQL